MKERTFRRLLFFLPLFFGAFIIFVHESFLSRYYEWLTTKGGPIENGKAAMLFFASLMAFASLKEVKKIGKWQFWLYLGFAVGTLLMSIDVMRWGQRILLFDTPGYLSARNYQDEVDIHNLNIMKRFGLLHNFFIVTSFYAAFASFLIPKKIKERYPREAALFTPDSYLFLYFFPALLFYVYYFYLSGLEMYILGDKSPFAHGFMRGMKDEEPFEMLWTMGFFLFSTINGLRLTASNLVPVGQSPLLKRLRK